MRASDQTFLCCERVFEEHDLVCSNKFSVKSPEDLAQRIHWRCRAISEHMINEQIRDREVRLIDEDGTQLGIMSAKDAQKLAREKNLDLVKISPKANKPVV